MGETPSGGYETGREAYAGFTGAASEALDAGGLSEAGSMVLEGGIASARPGGPAHFEFRGAWTAQADGTAASSSTSGNGTLRRKAGRTEG